MVYRQRLKHITLVERHKPHTAAAAALFMSQTKRTYSRYAIYRL